MTLSTQVSTVLSQVRELTSVTASVSAGMDALQDRITDLQAQIATAPSLSDEDKKGLEDAATELSSAVEALREDIPASTSAAGDNVADGSAAPAAPDAPLPGAV